MPERTSYVPGIPCWTDLATPDLEKATAFYRELFGWDVEDVEGGYRFFVLRGSRVAGVVEQSEDMKAGGVPSAWVTYVAGQVETEVGAARASGGDVVTEPAPAGDFGRVAVLTDPEGAMFGVWEAGTFHGAELVNEPGAMSWSELNARSLHDAIGFYSAVFGWEAENVDTGGQGPPYVTWMIDGEAVGGALELQPEWGEMSPYWVTYFAVTDADAAVETIASGGGQAFTQPRDSEFGRWAAVADPFGAPFVVIQPTAPA
jgi:uncharacterized protein